jgi:hypothetical protein
VQWLFATLRQKIVETIVYFGLKQNFEAVTPCCHCTAFQGDRPLKKKKLLKLVSHHVDGLVDRIDASCYGRYDLVQTLSRTPSDLVPWILFWKWGSLKRTP